MGYGVLSRSRIYSSLGAAVPYNTSGVTCSPLDMPPGLGRGYLLPRNP
jgi:hypothetical protein